MASYCVINNVFSTNKMNFRKILDGVNVQAYKINKPTKTFKKLFPKQYICSVDVLGKHMVFNVDELPRNFALYPPIGYIFTYANSLPACLVSDKLKYKNVGSVCPSCLDDYFTATNDKVDLILSICPKDKIVPAKFVNEIVVQCCSDELLKKGVKDSVMSILKTYLEESNMNTEQWARKVIFNYPINGNGLPVKYPKKVSDKTLNSITLKDRDVFIEYDLRAKSYSKEDEVICELENAFEDMEEELTVFDTYNGIMKKIMKELDKKKLKYKVEGEDKIKVKAKHLRKLDLTYQMTDFI